MAVCYNPAIIINGLAMCLDGANVKSYSGSGVTWSDLSAQQNIAVFVNGPTFSSSNSGVISLDGTNDYIKLTPGVFGVGTNAFTISIWFNTSSGGVLLSQAYNQPTNIDGDGAAGMYVDSNGKLVTTCFYDGQGNIAGTSTYSVNNGNWNNATVSVAPVNAYSVVHISYLNAVSFDSRTRSQPNVASNSGYFIGGGRYLGFLYPNWPASSYLNCKIGHVALYRRTLSATEILQNFNALRGRFGV